MTPLIECLNRVVQDPLGTIVHIGAGSGAVVPVYAAADARQVLLVEGDPQLARALRLSCADHPRLDVVDEVLRPQAGPVAWRRYNLAALNGPLPALGLRTIYPRLQELAQDELPGHAIADWMSALDLPSTPDRPHLLVIDLPGQEGALLEAMPPEVLQRFGHVLLRGCAQPPAPPWTSMSDAARILDGRFFVRSTANRPQSDDTLWPIAAFTLDRRAQRGAELERHLAQRAHELDATRAQLCEEAGKAAQAQTSLQAAITERDALQAALAARQAQLEAQATQAEEAAREWEARMQALRAQCDAFGSRAEETSAQARMAQAERMDMEQRLAVALRERDEFRERFVLGEQAAQLAARSVQTQLEALQAEREQESRGHAEQRNLALALQSEKDLLLAQLEELRLSTQAAESAWQARLDEQARERSAGDASLERAAARIAELENVVRTQSGAIDELAVQQQQRQSMLDDATRLRSEHESREASLREERDRLATELQLRDQLNAGLLAQVGSLERDSAEREKAFSGERDRTRSDFEAAQAQLDALRAERDQEAHWLAESKQWASALKVEKEALEQAQAAVQDQIRALRDQAAQSQAQHASDQAQLRAEIDVAHQDTERLRQDMAQAEQDWQAQMTRLRAERDQEAHWHAENKKWALALKIEKEALEQAQAAVHEQIQALRDQTAQTLAQQASDQAQLRAEIDVARQDTEKLRQEKAQAEQDWQAQMTRLREERNHEAHWHAEHKKWAATLTQEKEALTARLQAAGQELDAVKGRLTAADAAEKALRAELADRDARQRMLDGEILRAEAQLDLIKDVLIREKNF